MKPGEAAAAERAPYRAWAWRLREDLVLEPSQRPLVMGILNLTPDSFYPDSRRGNPDDIVATGLAMVEAGADLLDLGAESSRPGAESISGAEERARLLPGLRALRRRTAVPISVDTIRSETARAALDEGADAINDISAATMDPAMLPLIGERGCGIVLMHMQGTPRSMQQDPRYQDVVAEVGAYLAGRAEAAVAAGAAAGAVVVDPGIGFGKTVEHNLALLAALDRFGGRYPVLIGASRKSFIGAVTGAAVADRLSGSLAALAAAYAAGVSVVRVHDVGPSRQFLDILAAIAAADGGAEIR